MIDFLYAVLFGCALTMAFCAGALYALRGD